MWEWGAMRDERVAEAEGGGGTALWATGAEDEAPAVEVFMTLDMMGRQAESERDEEDKELVQFERVLDRETRVEILRLSRLSALAPPRCISATGLKLRLYPPNLHSDKVGSTL